MLTQSRLLTIQQMDQVLNQAENLLTDSETLLQRWQDFLPQLQRLEQYYFGEDWRADYDAYEQGEIPPKMPCGVLSEDAIFNLCVSKREYALQLMKLAIKLLETE